MAVSTYPYARVVDAPSTAATVLFDLHGHFDGVRTFPIKDDWDLGAPQLVGDPDSEGVAYSDRTIAGTLAVDGAKTTALRAQSKLARVLMRREAWLEFQLAEHVDPVWFLLRRPTPGALSFRNVRRDADVDRWYIPLSFPAAPFAWGAPESIVATVVANDPAAAENGLHMVLPPIKGDAPVPLRIQVNPNNPPYMNGYRWLTAMHSSWTGQGPILWKIGTRKPDGTSNDGWAAGADTSEALAGSASTYVAGTYRNVAFTATPGLATRISGVGPSIIPAGRWKTLVRVRRNDTTSTFILRFGQTMGLGQQAWGDQVPMDRAPSDASGHTTWVDLGDFTFPFGVRVPAGQEGIATPPEIALQIGRLTGSGAAQADALLFVPLDLVDTVEARTLYSDFPNGGIFVDSGLGIWDGETERFWAYSQFGTLAPVSPDMEGQFLRATPGAENVLTLLQQVNGQESIYSDDNSDVLTATTQVAITYQPRYLWIGDGS